MRVVLGHPTLLPYLEAAIEAYSKLCKSRNSSSSALPDMQKVAVSEIEQVFS
jgi:hypothetical protein